MRIYLKISQAMEHGIWKETHFFQSIGYPWLISVIRNMTEDFGPWLTMIQTSLSSLSMIFFYFMTKESLGKKVALFSLLLGSVHLPWIFFTNFALPETLFIFLLSVSGFASVRMINSHPSKLLFSFLWATAFIMAFFLKGTHAFWGPLFLAGLFWIKGRRSLKPILLISVIVGTGLLSHGLLAQNKVGKFQISPSTSGLNFVEGKCPSKVNIDSLGYHWQSPLYFQLGLHKSKTWKEPFTNSGYFLREGLKCIQDNPYVLLQSLESIPYLFYGNTTWPFNRLEVANLTRLYEVFFTLFVIPGLLFFLLRFPVSGSSREAVIWIMPVLALFLCVYIFKSEMRYRIPFDLWIIPMAVKGWLEIAATRKKPLPA